MEVANTLAYYDKALNDCRKKFYITGPSKAELCLVISCAIAGIINSQRF
jgi:hypothetical protein